MNANRALVLKEVLKNILVASVVCCGIAIFVLEKGSEKIGITQPKFYQEPDTNPIPHEIRNNWYKQDLDDAVYILSAIGSNTTNHVMYERDIYLNGWLDSKNQKENIKCCFLWRNGTISQLSNPKVLKSPRKSKLKAMQIACHLNTSHTGVSGVTATSLNIACPTADDELYIRPFIPKKEASEESFAICLKLVYGNVDNTLFIEWLEFYRKMQVDKIFIFTHKITDETTKGIIKRYVHMGLLQTRPFALPKKSGVHIGQKRVSYFESELVMIYDCLQRSAGYKYMAIVDMDEFLLPRVHGNIKELMKYMMWKNPNAAGFRLISYIFDKNVKSNKTKPANSSTIVQYFRRTQGLTIAHSRNKNILLPARITVKGLRTHNFKPVPPFTRAKIDSSIASINHYRECYNGLKKRFCSGNLIKDTDILRFVDVNPEIGPFPGE